MARPASAPNTVLDASRREIFQQKGVPAPAPSGRVAIGGGDAIAALRRAAIRASISMNTQPEAVFAALTRLITRGDQVIAAAQGLRLVPRPNWPKAEAGTAANALLAWAKAVPVGERTSQDYVETTQTADELAGLLPADSAAALRRELKAIRVAVFVIHTVREQMRYDVPRLVVEAGKPFEVIFENNDFMPHNLVFVQPGAREAVANLATPMKPDQFDKQGRAYVPNSPTILSATKLLDAGGKETLKLTAPTAEGTYEFVCTFPGHWTLMWGTLIVTRDVDAYVTAHPFAPQAKVVTPAAE